MNTKMTIKGLVMALACTFGTARADIVASGSYEGAVDPGSASPSWSMVSLGGSSYTIGGGSISNTSATGQVLYQTINWTTLFSADSDITMDIRFRIPSEVSGQAVFKVEVGFPAVAGYWGGIALGIMRGEIYSLGSGGFDTAVNLGSSWHTLRLVRTFNSSAPGVSTNWGLKVYLDDTYLGWAVNCGGSADVIKIGDSWDGGDAVAWDIDYIRWVNAAYTETPTAKPIIVSGSYEGTIDPGSASPAWSMVSLGGGSYTLGGGSISNASANGQVLYQTTNWTSLFSADSDATIDIRFRIPSEVSGQAVFKIEMGFPAIDGYGGGIALGIMRGEIYSLGSGGFDAVVNLGSSWHTLRLVRTFNSSDLGNSTNWGLEVYLDDTYLGWAVNCGGQADVIKIGDSWDGGEAVAWDIDYIRWVNTAYDETPTAKPIIVSGSYEGNVDPVSANPSWSMVSLYGSSYTVGGGSISNTSTAAQVLYQTTNWTTLFSADSDMTMDIRFRIPNEVSGQAVFKIEVGFPAVGGYWGSVALAIMRGEIYSLGSGGFDTVVNLGDSWHTLRLVRTFNSSDPGNSTNWGLEVYLDGTDLGWANNFGGAENNVIKIGDSWDGGIAGTWDIDYIRWVNAPYTQTPTPKPITVSGSYEGVVDPGSANLPWSMVSLDGSSYTVGGGFISNASANGQVLYQMLNWTSLFSANSDATLDIRFRILTGGQSVFKVDVGFPAVGEYEGGIALGIMQGEIYSLGSGGLDTVVNLGTSWHTLRLVRTFNSSDPGNSTNWGMKVYLDDTYLGWAVNCGGQADVIKIGDSWDGGDAVSWDIDYIRWVNTAYDVTPTAKPITVSGSYEGAGDPGSANPPWDMVSLDGSSYTVGDGSISNTSTAAQVLYQTTNWTSLFSADSNATMDIRFRIPSEVSGQAVFKIDVKFPAIGGYWGSVAFAIMRGEIYSLDPNGFDVATNLGTSWHTLRLVRTFNSSDPGNSTNWGLEVYLDDTYLGRANNCGGTENDMIKIGDSWDGGIAGTWDIDYIRWVNTACNETPAANPLLQDPTTLEPPAVDAVRMGWYTYILDEPTIESEVVSEGAGFVLALLEQWPNAEDSWCHSMVQGYLNSAQANDVKVIMGVHFLVRDTLNYLAKMVDAFKYYPVVEGWYIADEPYISGYSVSEIQAMYNIIKARTNTPVYICFNSVDLDHNSPYNYRNAYDVMMFDFYPYFNGQGAFQGLLEGNDGFKHYCDEAMTQAAAVGKPLEVVLPAFGPVPGKDWDNRLPTYGEERFLVYYSLFNNAQRVFLWAKWVGGQATPGPYPYDETQWEIDVATPLFTEMNLIGAAMKAGAIAGGVNVSNTDIRAGVYHDPVTGKYYLVALNKTSTAKTTTFTLNLPYVMIGAAVLQFESASTLAIQNNTFSDTLSGYGIHVYEITTSE
jgi:hypothetical protein